LISAVIKFVFRWAFRLILLAIVLVVALLLLKDTLARSFAERLIRQNTGFEVKIGKLQLGLFEPRVNVENLVLYNPPEFGGAPFLDAPDIRFDYVPGKLALRKIHFTFLRLDIREINIVESKGRTNMLEALPSPSPGQSTPYTFTGADLLNLSIERVRYSDLDRPKRRQDISLALENHIVRNIRSREEFVNLLLKHLFRAGITIYVDDRPRR
jgi:hypothetical protein